MRLLRPGMDERANVVSVHRVQRVMVFLRDLYTTFSGGQSEVWLWNQGELAPATFEYRFRGDHKNETPTHIKVHDRVFRNEKGRAVNSPPATVG